ncbi:MAG TPA: hypothetical protein VMR62_16045 [Bryobacteraceae bacterium]|jgi:hypothetical protein|nr:hypothetical protein [Bryobacteraceae bacterium]
MQIENQELRDYYAALADEELLALDRAELTDIARRYYDSEIARRQLSSEDTAPPADEERVPEVDLDADEDEPDWLENAACAIAYRVSPGNSAAADADGARHVLEAAGVPCHVSLNAVDPDDPASQYQYCVMVPGARNLEATGVLERELYNPQEESMWRTHFASLSDNEMRALNFGVICAGIEDRLARLKRAYSDEIRRRGL